MFNLKKLESVAKEYVLSQFPTNLSDTRLDQAIAELSSAESAKIESFVKYLTNHQDSVFFPVDYTFRSFCKSAKQWKNAKKENRI